MKCLCMPYYAFRFLHRSYLNFLYEFVYGHLGHCSLLLRDLLSPHYSNVAMQNLKVSVNSFEGIATTSWSNLGVWMLSPLELLHLGDRCIRWWSAKFGRRRDRGVRSETTRWEGFRSKSYCSRYRQPGSSSGTGQLHHLMSFSRASVF